MEQQIFQIPLKKKYDTTSFEVKHYNKEAYDAILSSKLGHPPYDNILIISGCTMSGKSHLCKTWQKSTKATDVIEYIEKLESFDSLDSIAFLHKMQELISEGDMFLDPIEFFDDTTEVRSLQSLVFIVNEMIKSNFQYILTSCSWPIRTGLRDLDTRLNSCHVVNMFIDDTYLIREVIERYFLQNDIKVDRLTISYLMYRMPSSPERIKSILDTINARSLSIKSSVSIKFLRSIEKKLF